jgi:hypothetical protein
VKDLDFDELDRAVNSMITGNSGSGSGGDTGAGQSKPEPDATSPDSPKAVTPSDAPKLSVTQSLAGRRSTGRFMDVIHPSSDMRGTLNMPERTPAPISSSSTPKLDIVTGNKPTPVTNDNQPVSPNNTVVEQQTAENGVADAPEKPDSDSDIEQISNDISKALGQGVEEPQSSPFVSGAKIEKRPLGAFSTDLTENANTEPTPQADAIDNISRQEPVLQHVDSRGLPPELQKDLLMIEADSKELLEEPDYAAVMPTDSANSDQLKAPEPAAVSRPVESTSIAQQYQEQPSTSNQTTNAIYDNNAYQKALLHPAKKKSGWMWVLWIVVLLVVGAVAGAAVYIFFVAPQM